MTRNLVTGQVHSVVKNEPFYKFVLFLSDRLGSRQEQDADGERLREAKQQATEGARRERVHCQLRHDAQGL